MMKAKIFSNGRSQAVRLPVPFRFDVSEVYVRRDPRTGDVILSKNPTDWSEFLASARRLKPSDTEGFLDDRDDSAPRERDLF